jgi:hypothetical protein
MQCYLATYPFPVKELTLPRPVIALSRPTPLVSSAQLVPTSGAVVRPPIGRSSCSKLCSALHAGLARPLQNDVLRAIQLLIYTSRPEQCLEDRHLIIIVSKAWR